MPNLTVSDAIDTFMGSADQSAARANLGIAAIPFGLPETTLSNNATDATNDIDFLTGVVVVRDGTNRIPVSFSGFTKRLDAAWAAGDNAGGLDTGSKANSTWYYAFAIYNPTTDAKDFLFSLSATAPTLPSGFTFSRRIGSIQTQSGGVIGPFVQVGNTVMWKTQVIDLDSVAVPESATAYTFTIPAVMCEILGVLNPGRANEFGSALIISVNSPLVNNIIPAGAPWSTGYRGDIASRYIASLSTSDSLSIDSAANNAWITSNRTLIFTKNLNAYFESTPMHRTTFQTRGFIDLDILRGL